MFASRLCKFGTNVTRSRVVHKPFSRNYADEIIVKDLRGIETPKQSTDTTAPNVEGKDFYIDTTKLVKRSRNHTHKQPASDFEDYLMKSIQLRGPLSVSTFMREALTNPKFGYYMSRDVFGSKGDFTTSPEISQMFGELLGIWCVSVWMQLGKPSQIQLVELGPGRGTLMHDLIRTAKQFKEFYNAIEVHFVEKSPALRSVQAEKLNTEYHEETPEAVIGSLKGQNGPKVFWHQTFMELSPREVPIIVLAQEFFDALPVHQFQKTSRGWMERLIDVDDDPSNTNRFKFVLSPGPTIASRAFLKDTQTGNIGDLIEVSPEASVLAESIAMRISKQQGAALIVDYGEDFPMPNTLRAIQNHQFKDIFHEIGKCDLSCFVDFSYLINSVARFADVKTYGSVSQKNFLHEMGIETRMNVLLKNATPKQQHDLISGYKRLTDPDDMGHVFKVFSLANEKLGTPAGFYSLEEQQENKS